MEKSQNKKPIGESAFERIIRRSKNRKEAFERLLRELHNTEGIPPASKQQLKEQKNQ